jgi:ABC-type amino acid transport system permease subunit
MRTSQKMVLDKAQTALAMLGGLSIKVIVTLVAFTGLGIVGIYFATTINSDLPLSDSGALAMIVGVTLTLILGVGLMSLIFFSSRNGYDEPPDVQSDERRD